MEEGSRIFWRALSCMHCWSCRRMGWRRLWKAFLLSHRLTNRLSRRSTPEMTVRRETSHCSDWVQSGVTRVAQLSGRWQSAPAEAYCLAAAQEQERGRDDGVVKVSDREHVGEALQPQQMACTGPAAQGVPALLLLLLLGLLQRLQQGADAGQRAAGSVDRHQLRDGVEAARQVVHLRELADLALVAPLDQQVGEQLVHLLDLDEVARVQGRVVADQHPLQDGL